MLLDVHVCLVFAKTKLLSETGNARLRALELKSVDTPIGGSWIRHSIFAPPNIELGQKLNTILCYDQTRKVTFSWSENKMGIQTRQLK